MEDGITAVPPYVNGNITIQWE